MTYLQEMALRNKNLPVPVLVEQTDSREIPLKVERTTRTAITDAESASEARESTIEPVGGPSSDKSRGGQKFDRKKYMRDYMKKQRAKPKKCPHCRGEL